MTVPAPPLSVAPMMDRTDRHYRVMMRQITRRTLLYTEMVTTGALVHGDRARYLGFDPIEHPIALQLGGDDPAALAECARMAADFGYDEVNLNVGCPSDRVQKGRFGACLMRVPDQVAACVAAMKSAVPLPITVKHRIGVDELDAYEDMLHFVDTVAGAGCDRFSVHARKAWLSGLSPKENRTVPPLRPEDVYRLKAERPHLAIEINGGVLTLDEAEAHRQHVDAVMIGRAAYDDPWIFSEADARFYGEAGPTTDRSQVVAAMVDYAERWVRGGLRLHPISRHLLPLFAHQPGGRRFRRILGQASQPGAGPELLVRALASLRAEGYLPEPLEDSGT